MHMAKGQPKYSALAPDFGFRNFFLAHPSPIHMRRPNFMLCSTTRKTRLRCSSIEWAQLKRRSKNGGGVPETPPTQQNRNNISKFWLITKTAKISTQGREPVSPDLFVLVFNGAPERQVQLRWLLIQSSPHPPTKEK